MKKLYKPIPLYESFRKDLINNDELNEKSAILSALKWIGKTITLNGYLTGHLANMLSFKARFLDARLAKYKQELERGKQHKDKQKKTNTDTDTGKIDVKSEVDKLNTLIINVETKLKDAKDVLSTELTNKKEKLSRIQGRMRSSRGNSEFELQINDLEDTIEDIQKRVNAKDFDLPDEDIQSLKDDTTKIEKIINKLKTSLTDVSNETEQIPNPLILKSIVLDAERIYTEYNEINKRLKNYWDTRLIKLKAEYSKFLSSDQMEAGDKSDPKIDEQLKRELEKALTDADNKLKSIKKLTIEKETEIIKLNKTFSGDLNFSEALFATVTQKTKIPRLTLNNQVYIMDISDSKSKSGKIISLFLRCLDGDDTIKIDKNLKSKVFLILSIGTSETNEKGYRKYTPFSGKAMYKKGNILVCEFDKDTPFAYNQEVTIYSYEKQNNTNLWNPKTKSVADSGMNNKAPNKINLIVTSFTEALVVKEESKNKTGELTTEDYTRVVSQKPETDLDKLIVYHYKIYKEFNKKLDN